MRLLGIGDNVLDHYVDTGVQYPGGNAVNVPVYAAHLGATADYIGIVGNDRQGDHLLAALAAERVGTSLVRRAVGPTGMPQVRIDATGDRIFVGSNKGGVQHGLRLRLTEDDHALAHRADVIHTSAYSSLEEVLGDLGRCGPISYDFSDHRTAAYLRKVCPNVSHAFLSGTGLSRAEAAGLARAVLAHGTLTAVVTLGGAGAWVARAAGAFLQEATPVDVVDTLGAGDGFIAGFLVAWYSGSDLRTAARAGSEAAAHACTFRGAFGRGMAMEADPEARVG